MMLVKKSSNIKPPQRKKQNDEENRCCSLPRRVVARYLSSIPRRVTHVIHSYTSGSPVVPLIYYYYQYNVRLFNSSCCLLTYILSSLSMSFSWLPVWYVIMVPMLLPPFFSMEYLGFSSNGYTTVSDFIFDEFFDLNLHLLQVLILYNIMHAF